MRVLVLTILRHCSLGCNSFHRFVRSFDKKTLSIPHHNRKCRYRPRATRHWRGPTRPTYPPGLRDACHPSAAKSQMGRRRCLLRSDGDLQGLADGGRLPHVDKAVVFACHRLSIAERAEQVATKYALVLSTMDLFCAAHPGNDRVVLHTRSFIRGCRL